MNLESNIDIRRTFGIISHPDAGKTTLTEKLLLFGGAINEAGAVKSNKIIRNIIITNILGEMVVSYDGLINTNGMSKGIYIVDIYFANGDFAKNKLVID